MDVLLYSAKDSRRTNPRKEKNQPGPPARGAALIYRKRRGCLPRVDLKADFVPVVLDSAWIRGRARRGTLSCLIPSSVSTLASGGSGSWVEGSVTVFADADLGHAV